MSDSEATIVTLRQRIAALETALDEALYEWAYASQYKGEYLALKHGDAEAIAEIRARLGLPGRSA